MADRQTPLQPDQKALPDRPVEQLGCQLNGDLDPTSDPASGAVRRLTVGPGELLSIELYPAPGALRLTSRHGPIECFQQLTRTLQEDLLLFSHHNDEEIKLSIDQQKMVVRRILPRTASATPGGAFWSPRMPRWVRVHNETK